MGLSGPLIFAVASRSGFGAAIADAVARCLLCFATPSLQIAL